MKSLMLATAVFLVLLVASATLWQKEPHETQALPIVGEYQAEWIMREADLHIFGQGGYSVYIWPAYWQGQDVAIVGFWGYGLTQMGNYICLKGSFGGWDCSFWRY